MPRRIVKDLLTLPDTILAMIAFIPQSSENSEVVTVYRTRQIILVEEFAGDERHAVLNRSQARNYVGSRSYSLVDLSLVNTTGECSLAEK